MADDATTDASKDAETDPTGTYRLDARATFRPDDDAVSGTDERGFIREGQSFTIEGTEAGKATRERLIDARLAAVPTTTIVHHGGGWYDVVDDDGKVLNTDGRIQGGPAARQFAAEHTDYDAEG